MRDAVLLSNGVSHWLSAWCMLWFHIGSSLGWKIYCVFYAIANCIYIHGYLTCVGNGNITMLRLVNSKCYCLLIQGWGTHTQHSYLQYWSTEFLVLVLYSHSWVDFPWRKSSKLIYSVMIWTSLDFIITEKLTKLIWWSFCLSLSFIQVQDWKMQNCCSYRFYHRSVLLLLHVLINQYSNSDSVIIKYSDSDSYSHILQVLVLVNLVLAPALDKVCRTWINNYMPWYPVKCD